MQQAILELGPRISVNKLGEYLVSPPLRRQGILERQKYPSALVAAHYEPARRIIIALLTGRLSRQLALLRVDAWTSATHFESDYARHRAHGCADAVMRFLALRPRLEFEGTEVHVPVAHDKLQLHGVDVSIQPDVLLQGRDDRGRDVVGAIKLHFPKTHPLTPASAEYVATMLHVYLREVATVRAEPSLCVVVDVFSGTIVHAPRAYRRRLRDIGAACQEISMAWPRV